MIHRKFLPANQNKHRYGNLTKHHIATAVLYVFQLKSRGRRKYGYERCGEGELANLACSKAA